MKKKIPIVVWHKIQPIIDQNKVLFRALKSDQYTFHLVDHDEESEFEFICNIDSDDRFFNIEFQPKSRESVSKVSIKVDLNGLEEKLISWVSILKEYSSTHTFYDDYDAKPYEDEFYTRLEIQDPNVANQPLTPDGQLFLDQYIDKVKVILQNYKTDRNRYELELIEKECIKLQKSLPVLEANQAMRQLAKIWGKAQKFSLKLITDLLKSFRTEMMKTIASQSMTGVLNWINTIFPEGSNPELLG